MSQTPRLIALDQVDSTNDDVRRRRAEGEPAPFWVCAAAQTAGRGRRGRRWVSERGNLYASGIYDMAAPPAEVGQLSFAAALAAAEVAARAAPVAEVRVKWPNDVLVGDRKVAGVLLESRPRERGLELVVGVGVNLAIAPEGVERPATSLAAVSGTAPVDPAQAAQWLVDAFERWRVIWAERGFGPLREAWLAKAVGLGEEATARLADRSHTGVFADLDADGALILQTAEGRVRVHAGEVFFGDARTSA